jgi:hypothetical protein
MTLLSNDGFYEMTADSVLRYRFHRGQMQAWEANGRFVVVLSGTQGGKTTFGPPWLHREMQERGPGDYLVVTPTFALLDKKALPEFRKLFEGYLGLGRYVGSPTRRFEISTLGQKRLWGQSGRAYKTTIWFGYASDPDSLESSTAKAAWLDEAGQQIFRAESYEAIMRRLAIHQGRLLITTTPYYWGWLKEKFWDRRDIDPAIDLIHFESIMNPAFPRAEWDRARRDMPSWRFDMFYRARFTRPAGLIYGAFDPDSMTCRPFVIPEDWPRYLGLDFGGVNTAAVMLAESPDGKLYLYREYHAGDATAAAHAVALLAGEPGEFEAFGGAPGEDQWRKEFRAAGLHVRKPVVSDVEVGINRVYSIIANERLIVFDSCSKTLDELATYSRVTDDAGNALEAIADKSKYHLLDALRYVGAYLIDGGEPEMGHVDMPDPLEDLRF